MDGVYRLSCLCCLGDGPSIELIPHPGEDLHVLVSSKKCTCDPELVHEGVPSHRPRIALTIQVFTTLPSTNLTTLLADKNRTTP